MNLKQAKQTKMQKEYFQKQSYLKKINNYMNKLRNQRLIRNNWKWI